MKQQSLNQVAHSIKKPVKGQWIRKGATEYLNANRKGIAKLRKRGFSWGEITKTLERIGVNIDYNNVYQWQLRTYTHNKAK